MQRADELQFLLRHHPGEDADRADTFGQLLIGHRGEFLAGDAAALMVQTDLAGDRHRGARVVPGDHDRADGGAPALRDGIGHPGSHRIMQAGQTEILEVVIMLFGGQFSAGVEVGVRHTEDPLTVSSGVLDLLGELREAFGVEVAEIGDGLGGALGRDHVPSAVGRAPHVRECEQFLRQRVLANQFPVGVHVFGSGQVFLAEVPESLVHRIERVDWGGQHRELGDRVELFGQRLIVEGVDRTVDDQLANGHLVQRQRAGLVHAQHGRRSQRLDHRWAAGQNVLARHPPRAQCQEHREDDGELLGQQSHRGCDTGQHSAQPVPPGQPVDHHHDGGGQNPHDGKDFHQTVDLALQPGGLGFDGAQRRADPAQFGCGAGVPGDGDAMPLDHEGAGEHPRRGVPAGATHLLLGVLRCNLADRHRLPGQRGLVDGEVGGFAEHGVGGHPVALGQQHHVAADDVAPGDPDLLAVADHQGSRRGQIAQRGQGAFGLVFLIDRDTDHHEDECHQHRAVHRLGQQEVHRTGGQ